MCEFALFSFETWRVNLEIHFTASDKVEVIFDLIRSIALNVLRVLSLTSKHGMSLLLVVLALGNIRIYVCISNSGDIASHIEGSIDKSLGR